MTTVGRILRVSAWTGTVALIVAFLLGYSGPYLPPASYWWTDLFAVVLPPLSVAMACLGVALTGTGAYRGRWGRVVLGVGLLVLILVRFGPRLVGRGERAGAPAMRLMTFNVPPVPDRASNAPVVLAELIDATGPDVVAFQESWMASGRTSRAGIHHTSPSLRQLVADSLGYGPPAALPADTRIYQPVFGRARLDSLSMYRSPLGEDGDPLFRYTRTEFRWAGRPAVLYNIHLHTVGNVRPWRIARDDWWSLDPWLRFAESYRTAALRRAAQARAIRERIDREKHPVIVVGDFNSTPHQWAYRHIADGMENALQEGAWGPTPTFPAQRPLVQIDHILMDADWQVTEAQVQRIDGSEPVSDHRPVLVELQWRGD